MSSRRAQRVATLIRQEIATMIVEGQFRDPALGPAVTITGASVSPDLRVAKVTISLLAGDEAAEERVLAAFARVTPFLRGELGRRLKLRFAPELRFVADRSIAYAQEIEDIVSRVLPEAPAPEADTGSDDDERD